MIRAIRRILRHFNDYLVLYLAALVLLCIFLAPKMLFTLKSGHAGVIFKRFAGGTETNFVYREGFVAIPPWDELHVYDIRLREVSHSFDIIAADGLSVDFEVSIRFRPNVEELAHLHREVGPDYEQKIILPEIKAVLRRVVGNYTPEEIYTSKRALIQRSLSQGAGEIGERFLTLDDILITSITLPTNIRSAIEAKLVQQQEYLKMEYLIKREREEALRKVIEADGVQAYNNIVGDSLTEDILRYRGIEATLALAMSSNAKVVLIGGGSEGLPIILNADAAPAGGTGVAVSSDETKPATDSKDVEILPDDIKNFDLLVDKLSKRPDPVSAYLWDALKPETRRLFGLASEAGFESVGRQALARDLTEIVNGPSIYTKGRFDDVALSDRTKELIETAAATDALPELNLALLRDAFPGLIEPASESATGDVD